jgi:hypothetical protein
MRSGGAGSGRQERRRVAREALLGGHHHEQEEQAENRGAPSSSSPDGRGLESIGYAETREMVNGCHDLQLLFARGELRRYSSESWPCEFEPPVVVQASIGNVSQHSYKTIFEVINRSGGATIHFGWDWRASVPLHFLCRNASDPFTLKIFTGRDTTTPCAQWDLRWPEYSFLYSAAEDSATTNLTNFWSGPTIDLRGEGSSPYASPRAKLEFIMAAFPAPVAVSEAAFTGTKKGDASKTGVIVFVGMIGFFLLLAAAFFFYHRKRPRSGWRFFSSPSTAASGSTATTATTPTITYADVPPPYSSVVASALPPASIDSRPPPTVPGYEASAPPPPTDVDEALAVDLPRAEPVPLAWASSFRGGYADARVWILRVYESSRGGNGWQARRGNI